MLALCSEMRWTEAEYLSNSVAFNVDMSLRQAVVSLIQQELTDPDENVSIEDLFEE